MCLSARDEVCFSPGSLAQVVLVRGAQARPRVLLRSVAQNRNEYQITKRTRAPAGPTNIEHARSPLDSPHQVETRRQLFLSLSCVQRTTARAWCELRKHIIGHRGPFDFVARLLRGDRPPSQRLLAAVSRKRLARALRKIIALDVEEHLRRPSQDPLPVLCH